MCLCVAGHLTLFRFNDAASRQASPSPSRSWRRRRRCSRSRCALPSLYCLWASRAAAHLRTTCVNALCGVNCLSHSLQKQPQQPSTPPTTTLLHLLLLLLLSCLRLTNAVTGNHYIHLVGPSPPSAPPPSAAASPPSTCVTSCVHKLQAASTASVYKTREGCDCCCCSCC